MSSKYSLMNSFKFAFEGFFTAVKREPNFRIHLSIAAVALLLATILGFSRLEWLILMFTIGFVLLFELLNTVLEAIIDLVSPEVKPTAKVAKDVSAAAVLFASFMAILVGLALFTPKILSLLY